MHVLHRTQLVFLGAVALLCTAEWWIVSSVWFALNPAPLAFAVTIDLTLGIPLLFYLFLVRTGRSRVIALAPVFLLSVVIANLLLPPTQHTYLDRIEYLLPFIECAVGLFVLVKARTVVREYRTARPQTIYASDALAASLRRAIGPGLGATLLATELSLPYYALLGWRASFTSPDARHVPFSYHRKSGYGGNCSQLS